MATATCCAGDGAGGHHPFCESQPRGIEVRGVIAMNGQGDICFFADSRAEGLPLIDKDGRWRGESDHRLYHAIADAPVRRVSHEDLATLDPPAAPEHDCDAELRARPDYSVGRGTPEVFDCSCGLRYAYCDSESEGAWWERVSK